MKTRFFKYLLILFIPFAGLKAESSQFIWRELPPLPPAMDSGIQAGLAVLFAGMHNGVLLVAGGFTHLVERYEKQYHDAVYVLLSCQRYYDVIASLRSNPEASNQAWIASCLIMTNLVTPSLRGTKQSRLSRMYLDCFVPRNDGDLM